MLPQHKYVILCMEKEKMTQTREVPKNGPAISIQEEVKGRQGSGGSSKGYFCISFSDTSLDIRMF